MPEIRDFELVDKLIDATRNKKLAWEKTASADQYSTSYGGKWTLSVDLAHTRDESDFYFLTITNAEGEQVLRIYEANAPLLRDLFELARRQALKVDEALADLFKEIEGDIPF